VPPGLALGKEGSSGPDPLASFFADCDWRHSTNRASVLSDRTITPSKESDSGSVWAFVSLAAEDDTKGETLT
jgi:hypothetical protein